MVIPESQEQFSYALAVADEMRRLRPGAVVETDLSGKGLKRGLARAGQILEEPGKYAFRVFAVRAVLLGGNEEKDHTVTIRDLANHVQETVSREELPALWRKWESS